MPQLQKPDCRRTTTAFALSPKRSDTHRTNWHPFRPKPIWGSRVATLQRSPVFALAKRLSIWDVAVDVRPGSATFGEWVAAELDAEAGTQIWVPPGFAHGFCVLSEEALVLYKNTSLYDPNGQYSVRWDDPAIGIEWPDFGAAILSEKDAGAPLLAEIAPSVLAEILRDGIACGQVTSAAWGETTGSCVGLAYLRGPAPVTADWIRAGTYEVNVGGQQYPITVSLRPIYDPSSARVRSGPVTRG